MKTVANLFSTAYTRLGADHQKDRHFMTIERLSPDEDGYGTYVKSVEGLAQNEYWIAREKNILMLLKKTPHVVRLRKEEEKTNNSYQTVKTKDAGISLAHWLRTKPTLAATQQTLKHPLEPAGAFLNLTKYCLIALKGIHQVGVIHANLRADNICIPYAPRPYEFDTEVKLDYEGLTLIDFMFSISSTLKLSRPLPISLTTTPSTQSDMLLMALSEDKKNRNTDFIQRLDYSVDLYALGFILDQIFQQNLRYPEGLDAELSMEIHSFIHELKSYKQGVPDSIKMRFLHLLPHDDYIQRIEHLLSLDYRSANADSQLFTFDPAQFLEDDSLFSTDNGLSLAPESENDQNNEKESDLPLPVSTPIEKTTMKDTMPSSTQTKDISADDSHIEIDKSVVIILIVTAQLLFFVFQEGKSLGLDVSSSMGLILLIGVCAAFAGKLLTPAPAPRLRPIIIEPVTEVLAKEGSNDSNAAVSSKPEMDEFDLIAASVPLASTAVESNDNSHLSIAETVTPEPLANVAEVSLVNEAIVAEVEIPLVETHEADQMVVEEAAEVAPALAVNREATNSNSVTTEHSNVVLLKTESTPPIISAEKDEHIEVNKWAVILAILALQVGFFFLTTDISSPTKPAVATDTPEIAPEVTPAVMPEEVAPVEEAPVEAVGTTDDAGATDIALLSERSSVKMPQPKMTSPAAVTASTLTTENGTPKTKAVATAKEKASKEKPLNETTTATTDNVTETTTTTTTPEKVVTPVAATPATPAAAPTETKTESKPVTTTKSLTQRLAASQNEQGWFYYNGHSSAGIKQDYEEAFKWFQKAANLGEPSAQFNVGMMYAEGKGTKQDFIEAAKWYKKSAEQGKASAQLNLGMMYISGRGIRQNLPEGVKWLNKAADQGDTTAKTNLIWLTQQGYLDNVAAPAADTTNK
jgi:hypothetical protein